MSADRPIFWGTFSKVVKSVSGYEDIENKNVSEHVIYAKSLKGERKETDKERAERVHEETRALETESLARAEQVAATEAKQRESVVAETAAKAAHTAQVRVLARVRAELAANPEDSNLHLRLLVAERSLKEKERTLLFAEESVLASAVSVEEARKHGAEVNAVQTEAIMVGEKQRQLNYAHAIRGNRKAADQVRKYAGKDSLGKVLDAIERAAKKED